MGNKYRFEDSNTGKSKRVHIQHTEDDIIITLPDTSGKLVSTNTLVDILKDPNQESGVMISAILKPDISENNGNIINPEGHKFPIAIASFRTTEAYVGKHDKTEWQASSTSDFTNIIDTVISTGNKYLTSWYPNISEPSTEVYVRYRFYSGDLISPWSDGLYFTTPAFGIRNFTIQVDESVTPVINTSGFEVFGINRIGPTKHVATTWRILDKYEQTVYLSEENTVDLVRHKVPAGNLNINTEYTVEVIYYTDNPELYSSNRIRAKFDTPNVYIMTPILTYTRDKNNNFTNPFTVVADMYRILNSDEKHVSTSWVVYGIDKNNRKTLLLNLERNVNYLTKLNLSKIMSTTIVKYVIEATFHSSNFNSARGSLQIEAIDPEIKALKTFEVIDSVTKEQNNFMPYMVITPSKPLSVQKPTGFVIRLIDKNYKSRVENNTNIFIPTERLLGLGLINSQDTEQSMLDRIKRSNKIDVLIKDSFITYDNEHIYFKPDLDFLRNYWFGGFLGLGVGRYYDIDCYLLYNEVQSNKIRVENYIWTLFSHYSKNPKRSWRLSVDAKDKHIVECRVDREVGKDLELPDWFKIHNYNYAIYQDDISKPEHYTKNFKYRYVVPSNKTSDFTVIDGRANLEYDRKYFIDCAITTNIGVLYTNMVPVTIPLGVIDTPFVNVQVDPIDNNNFKLTITGSKYIFSPDGRPKSNHVDTIGTIYKDGKVILTWRGGNNTTKVFNIRRQNTGMQYNTSYNVKLQYIAQNGVKSNEGITTFNTGQVPPVIIRTPTVSNNLDIKKITGRTNGFHVSGLEDKTHKATNWWLRQGNTNVWVSLNNTSNLTEVDIPENITKYLTTYVLEASHIASNGQESKKGSITINTLMDPSWRNIAPTLNANVPKDTNTINYNMTHIAGNSNYISRYVFVIRNNNTTVHTQDNTSNNGTKTNLSWNTSYTVEGYVVFKDGTRSSSSYKTLKIVSSVRPSVKEFIKNPKGSFLKYDVWMDQQQFVTIDFSTGMLTLWDNWQDWNGRYTTINNLVFLNKTTNPNTVRITSNGGTTRLYIEDLHLNKDELKALFGKEHSLYNIAGVTDSNRRPNGFQIVNENNNWDRRSIRINAYDNASNPTTRYIDIGLKYNTSSGGYIIVEGIELIDSATIKYPSPPVADMVSGFIEKYIYGDIVTVDPKTIMVLNRRYGKVGHRRFTDQKRVNGRYVWTRHSDFWYYKFLSYNS